MFNIIIVRYGELALKSPGVRNLYEGMLMRNIKAMLTQRGAVYSKVYREWGRIFVKSGDPVAVGAVADVFGVVSASEAVMIDATSEAACRMCADIAQDHVKKGESFGIRARRSGNHPFTSTELGKMCGDAVWERLESLGHSPSVDLTSPDKEIFVEMRQDRAYVYTHVVKGVGGLPPGSQGKMVALMSGGIDSPVAAWLLMRRGVHVIPVYINNSPYADETTHGRAHQCIEVLQRWSPADPLKVYEVPNGENMNTFLDSCGKRNICLICKRTMYRLAYEVMKKEKAHGIITGSSLGQVASQTAANMHAEIHGLGIPIYHPLISFDKTEIIDLARRIGTYKISTLPSTGCLAVPDHPEIKARYDLVEKEEKELDIRGMIDSAMERARWYEAKRI